MTGQRQGTNQPIAASFPPAVWRNPLCLPPPRGGTCPTSVSSLEALAFVGLQAELRLGGLCGLWVFLSWQLLVDPPHLSPFCTTRFLQVRQHEHAWLHSKISGGSAMLNSGRSRPSWRRDALKTGLVFVSVTPPNQRQAQRRISPSTKRARQPQHGGMPQPPPKHLNFCRGFSPLWEWHASHYHKQLTNSKKPPTFLLPGITQCTTNKKLFYSAVQKMVCIIIIITLQCWRGEADALSISGIKPKLPDYKASTPKF